MDLPIQFSYRSEDCSTVALIEKINPVVPEMYRFEYRKKSITKTLSIYGTIGILMKRTNSRKLNQFLVLWVLTVKTLIKELKPLVNEENEY